MKKTFVFPIYSLAMFIVGVVSIIFYAVVKVLQTMGTLLYFSGINTNTLYFTILCAGCMLVLASIAVFLFKNFKHKWISVIISAILAFMVIFFLSFVRFCMYDTDYFEFTSNDGKHNIVIEEGTWLLDGGGKIYEKISLFTMKEVGSYSTDDCYRPFTHNDYYFIWNENDFEIHLISGHFFKCYGSLEYVK